MGIVCSWSSCIDGSHRSYWGRAGDQPGFDVLLALVKSGKAYVKLSATYRISDQLG
jgi:hypothetical protein